MTQRRFGPTQGAGAVVVESSGDRVIVPAALGIACLFGKFRKGDTGELIHAPTKSDFERKLGDYVSGSEAPDCAFDFFNTGNGKGELYAIRLTDGTEVDAGETVFSRHLGHGYRYGVLEDPTWDEVKRPLLMVSAHNGGRWGGRRKVLTGSVASVGSDISPTTITTAQTMLLNQYEGATLRLAGVTGKTYEVVSNSTAGVVTVQSDQDMEADLAAGSDPTNAAWELVLDQEIREFPTRLAGTRRGLSVVFKDGEEDETSLFGMDVYEDEVLVGQYNNLSLDEDNKWFIESVVNENESEFYVSTDNLFSGTHTSAIRPANWYGTVLEWASDTATIQICHVRSVTSVNANVGWVGSFTVHGTPRTKKQKITITFTNATTFTVATDAADGSKHTSLANGTVGTAYAAANRHTVGFTIFAGEEAWSTGDIIVIDVLPLPVDEDGTGLLAGGFFYYDLGSDPRAKLQIKTNTVNTVTLTSAPSPEPDECERAGSLNTGTLVFPLTLTDTTLMLIHSGFGVKTLTIAAGAHATNAALATAINTAWTTAGGTGAIAAASSTPTNSVNLSPSDSGDDDELGYESFIIVGSNDNSELGMTAGDFVLGTLGSLFRIEAPTELRDGYDGADPGQAEYLAAAQPTQDSLVNRLLGQNKGLVKLATPGITTTVVQQAFLQLAEAYSYQYRVEIPSNITTDSEVVAYINDTLGRNDFGLTFFPSYVYKPNPQGNGVVLRSATGLLLGREALEAAAWEGYHKVPAGEHMTLPIVKLPTGNRKLNEEILNPAGVNVIKKVKGNWVMWGARTISLDPNWRFRQQRETMSYIGRQLLENFDYIIFAINDPTTRQSLITTMRAFLLPMWQIRALRGDKPEQAFSIKCDAENNTNLTMAQGDLNMEIKLRLADTVERPIFRIGKAGVFESLG